MHPSGDLHSGLSDRGVAVHASLQVRFVPVHRVLPAVPGCLPFTGDLRRVPERREGAPAAAEDMNTLIVSSLFVSTGIRLLSNNEEGITSFDVPYGSCFRNRPQYVVPTYPQPPVA